LDILNEEAAADSDAIVAADADATETLDSEAMLRELDHAYGCSLWPVYHSIVNSNLPELIQSYHQTLDDAATHYKELLEYYAAKMNAICSDLDTSPGAAIMMHQKLKQLTCDMKKSRAGINFIRQIMQTPSI
jgi:hypothetical protein